MIRACNTAGNLGTSRCMLLVKGCTMLTKDCLHDSCVDPVLSTGQGPHTNYAASYKYLRMTSR